MRSSKALHVNAEILDGIKPDHTALKVGSCSPIRGCKQDKYAEFTEKIPSEAGAQTQESDFPSLNITVSRSTSISMSTPFSRQLNPLRHFNFHFHTPLFHTPNC